ncbi:hypothetical protein ACLB2K_053234 [Fragaria x ananassa]
MLRIGFTLVLEAWCRVPKSPREGREVTGVKFRVRLARGNALMALRAAMGRCICAIWRGGPLLSESVRASWRDSRAIGVAGRCWASQFALVGETLALLALGKLVRARWRDSRANGVASRCWVSQLALVGETLALLALGELVRARWRDSRANGVAGRCWASQFALGGETLALMVWQAAARRVSSR